MKLDLTDMDMDFFSHPIGGTDRNVIILGVIQLILLKVISISISSVFVYLIGT